MGESGSVLGAGFRGSVRGRGRVRVKDRVRVIIRGMGMVGVRARLRVSVSVYFDEVNPLLYWTTQWVS